MTVLRDSLLYRLIPATRSCFFSTIVLLVGIFSTPNLHAADFGVVVMDSSVSTTQNINSASNAMIVKNRDNFEGNVTVKVTTSPAENGLEVTVNGKGETTLTPDNQIVELRSFAANRVPPGEYQVTVTLTGNKDGQEVTRVANYTLTIQAPPEFDLSVSPPHLVIKQGATADTQVITTFYKHNEAVINLVELLPPGIGISAEFSGGGWQERQIFSGFPEWIVTRDPDPEGSNQEKTNLKVSVSPETPPGDYRIGIMGIYNPDIPGLPDPIERERSRRHQVPLLVTVVADPQYAHLQDPPNFELFTTESVVTIPAGGTNDWGREVEIGVWGDRWNSMVTMSARMQQPDGGISVGILGSPRLRLPTNDRAYGRQLLIVVPESTPPGTYTATVSATSKAINGQSLTREVNIQIVVAAPINHGGDPVDPLIGLALPEGNPVEEGIPLEGPSVLDMAVDEACQILSEAAETIQCSVHTFKKPDLEEASPQKDVEIGQTGKIPDEAGGGYETEVFVRNPEDNNLRKGCGGMTPEILNQLTGSSWPVTQQPSDGVTTELRVVGVSCNAAADGYKEAHATVTRKRSSYRSDTSSTSRRKSAGNQQVYVKDKKVLPKSVLNDPRVKTCPPTPATPKGRMTHGDVKMEKVPEHLKTAVTTGEQLINEETKGIERLDAGLKGLSSINELMKDLGSESIDLKRFSAAAKFGRGLADLNVKSASGEKITVGDLKGVTDTVADLTGNKHVKTVAENFDVLMKLESMKIKMESGQRIETKDIKELADKLDTLRGERFKALGEVLGGIKKNAERITKAEDMIKEMEKVSKFLDKAAEGQNDPVKAFEAFSEYLDMIGGVAGKVPGMGEFMAKYAEAVKSMEGNVKTIAEAVKKRNEAINDKTHIEGYDYEKLQLDAQQFEEEFSEGTSSGERLSADQINVNLNTAEELAKTEDARRFWRDTQKCIIRESARMKALKQNSDDLIEEYKKLPPQKELDLRAQQTEERADFMRGLHRGSDSGVDHLIKDLKLSNAQRMGFGTLAEAKEYFSTYGNKEKYGSGREIDIADNARVQAERRELIKRHLKEIKKAWLEARKKRKDCLNRLESAELAYWQALRDYVAKYSYLSMYLETDKTKYGRGGKELRAKALAALDEQIIAQGFQVTGGRIEVKVVTECLEEKKQISVGN